MIVCDGSGLALERSVGTIYTLLCTRVSFHVLGVWTQDSAQTMKLGVGVASETVRKYKDGCLKKTIGFQKRLSPSALNHMDDNGS
jgi:hypothetical protein